MNKEKFMSMFEYNGDKKDASFYIDMKGIEYHYKIALFIDNQFEIKTDKMLWKKVSILLRYDKRLRDNIYIYLATLEEYIRAYLSNKYSDDAKDLDFWIENKRNKKQHIKDRVNNGDKLYDILEDIDLGTLINQVNALPDYDKECLFNSREHLKDNLIAVKELRNAVSHHKFLFTQPFKKCHVGDDEGNSLKHNIENLRQLLPKPYRYGKNGKGGITRDINKCRLDGFDQYYNIASRCVIYI